MQQRALQPTALKFEIACVAAERKRRLQGPQASRRLLPTSRFSPRHAFSFGFKVHKTDHHKRDFGTPVTQSETRKRQLLCVGLKQTQAAFSKGGARILSSYSRFRLHNTI